MLKLHLVKGQLGWVAEGSFKDGIPRTIDWYHGNEAWLDAIGDGTYQEG